MSKKAVVVRVFIDKFNHRDRKELYRHIRLMLLKTLRVWHRQDISQDKRNRISNILTIKAIDLIYNSGKKYYNVMDAELINHIGFFASIDLENCKYTIVSATEESHSSKNGTRPIGKL